MKQLQCFVLLSVTKSPGLLVQMVGRIIRPHEDKSCVYLLDYGTNCERLGNIDNIIVPKVKAKRGDAPKKLCLVPGCGEINLLSANVVKSAALSLFQRVRMGTTPYAQESRHWH